MDLIKNFKIIFFKPLFGALPKIFDLNPKVCADPSWLLVFKYSLKKSYSFQKPANLMVKMAKKCQKLLMTFFWTPKTPFFCIKDKTNSIYKIYAIYGPTFMPTPKTFEKVVMDPIRPNV